jgi:3-phenylpropionate/cinnamic acid dioxygenase small subunit
LYAGSITAPPWGSRVTDPQILARVDALQLDYIAALDARDMDGWAGCFGDPCSYVCVSRENEDQGLPLAIMMDDSRARIKDRINYVTKVWAGTFEDYTTRHFVQRLACKQDGSALLRVKSNIMVAYTTARGRSEILVAGIYEDEIDVAGAAAKFRSKRVILDTVATPRYLVYPI